MICQIITNLYSHCSFLKNKDILIDKDQDYWERVSADMDENDASIALYQLSEYLYRYYGKKVIILLDEYDAPMQRRMYTDTGKN